MKALLHYRASEFLQQRLRQTLPDWVHLVTVDEGEHARVLAEMADTEVLLHVLAPASREVMQAAPRLRFIQKIGVGLNTIDLAEARRRGIRVANMPGTNSQAVCEMALMLMLTVLRKTLAFDAATRSGRGWTLPLGSTDDVTEISGKTVGLLGYGQVARRLAPVLRALGARVIAHDVIAPADGQAEAVTLDTLLTQSDILSLHVPLTDDTQRILDAPTLARMKRGVVIINTARGALIDEFALRDALLSGQVRGAGLDVFGSEPVPSDHPLLTLPNVVLMPHLSWLTAETLERSFGVAADNIVRLRDGQPLRHEVAL